jgi:1,4-alpha-glucan branching enzyme
VGSGHQGPHGELALVLHTHLPHLAGHGVWPVGEEWLLQAWGTSWLPVTRLLEQLAGDGRRHLLTLSVSPTTAWQVADPRLAMELAAWLAAARWRAEEQRWHHRMGPQVTALGSHWWQHFHGLEDYHASVQSRGGLLAVWDALARAGTIELLAGPAMHPYLPLEQDAAMIGAALATGITAHRRWTAFTGGLWPPELGHRPAGTVGDPTLPPSAVDAAGTPTLQRGTAHLPGLEEHYGRHGVTHVVLDGPTLVRGAGGAERDWTRRPEPLAAGDDPGDAALHAGAWIGDSDVVAFGRDLAVAYHVWSPTEGYPGADWYLDHHATGGFGVHRSWRVTDRTLPPDRKQPYVPQRADDQARRDAEHFHGVVRDTLAARPGGVVVAAYDTELLGHWWHEGATWLGHVLDLVAADPDLTTTTLARRREQRPPTQRLILPESSWGFAKGHASWVTDATRPIWRTLADARACARTALADGRGPGALREQVARELAQLAASDWPFMTTRGQSAGYAAERVAGHATRVTRLCDAIDEWAATGHAPTVAEVLPDGADPVPPDVSAILAALDPTGAASHA